jgi:glycosyltransferase involved in cell wall biosynthesis
MFYGAIKTLIEDKALREDMGAKARKKVEDYFSVQVIGKRLADLLINSL